MGHLAPDVVERIVRGNAIDLLGLTPEGLWDRPQSERAPRLRDAAPVQSQSTIYAERVGGRRRPRGPRGDRPHRRPGRLRLHRELRPRGHSAAARRRHEHGLVRPRGHPLLPRRASPSASGCMSHVAVVGLRHPLRHRQAVRHPRPAQRRAADPRGRGRARTGGVRGARRRLRAARARARRDHRRAQGRARPGGVSRTPRRALRLRGPRPAAAARAGPTCPSGWAAPRPPPSAGPRSRGDGWLPQGDPRDQLPAQIARLRRLREEAGVAEPIIVGAIAEPLYVGEPDWSVGRRTLTGKPRGPRRVAARVRGDGRAPDPGAVPQP